MKDFIYLVKRNVKVYFNEKGLFLTSLITPAILLVLYATFLANVFESSFKQMLTGGLYIEDNLLHALTCGQLTSSLIAVSCITVAFSSNLLMIQDKVNGVIKDINVTPISKFKIGLSYLMSTFISTIIVNLVALTLCLIYTYTKGWYYSFTDVVKLILDVFVLTLFGCTLASVINFKFKSQGAVSGIGSIVSSGYGFICGAYMPISSFSKGLQQVISFLPGTYGTALVRNHAIVPVLDKIKDLPQEAYNGIKDGVDCNIYFMDKVVSVQSMYLVLIGTIGICLVIYLLMNKRKSKKTHA